MSKNVELDGQSSGLKREMGLAAATAIVIGNIIGSGIFMAPQSLAAASNPKATMVAWGITAIGSILIALTFARLSSKMSDTGGPIIYTRAAYGDFAAFLISWTYWIGCWVGNAALITACMNYLVYFIPVLGTNKLLAFIVSSAILWIFTLINIKGAKEAGIVGIITTVCKVLPLIIFAIIAAMHFNPHNFGTVSSPEVTGMKSVSSAIAITLWAFVGLEGATVAGGNIKNPEKNIGRSTIIGILFVALIYIVITVLAIGAMDQGSLAKSSAPLADIINNTTGAHWGGTLIAGAAIVSTLGATSGWLLVTAGGAMAAGRDKLFPAVFAKINPKTNTPVNALVISGIAANLMLIMNYIGSLQAAYNFMILLATLAFLPAYSFCAIGEILLLRKKSGKFNLGIFIKGSFFSLLGFIYSIYAIYGTGAEVVMYGFILMLAGMPFYVYMRLQNTQNEELNKAA